MVDYREALLRHGISIQYKYFAEHYCPDCRMSHACLSDQNPGQVEFCPLFNQWFSEIQYLRQHLNHFVVGENGKYEKLPEEEF